MVILQSLPDPEPYIFWLIDVDCSDTSETSPNPIWNQHRYLLLPAHWVWDSACVATTCVFPFEVIFSPFGTSFLWLSEPHVPHIAESPAFYFPFFPSVPSMCRRGYRQKKCINVKRRLWTGAALLLLATQMNERYLLKNQKGGGGSNGKEAKNLESRCRHF